MYEIYAKLRDEKGVKDSTVAKATGIGKSTFSDWKNGRSSPKDEKLQKIADYFGVDTYYLRTGKKKFVIKVNKSDLLNAMDKIAKEKGVENYEHLDYYTDPETAAVAQQIFDDSDLHALFDAARDSKPEDLRMAADLLKRLKETNRDE